MGKNFFNFLLFLFIRKFFNLFSDQPLLLYARNYVLEATNLEHEHLTIVFYILIYSIDKSNYNIPNLNIRPNRPTLAIF